MTTFSGMHLRHRLRAVVTMIAGAVPDDAAEARAVFNTMYDDCDDESIADLMRIATDELRFQRERVAFVNGMLDDKSDAATKAFDAIAAACGCAEWDYPGQVVRDVEAVVRERDEAVALISTLRAELAAAVEERDRLRAAVAPFVAKESADDITPDDWRALVDAYDGMPTPKRKRTKEERWESRRKVMAAVWGRTYGTGADVRDALRITGTPMTATDILGYIQRRYGERFTITDQRRTIQDLARAGYLTVAKGPGGVRVYSLKEGA